MKDKYIKSKIKNVSEKRVNFIERISIETHYSTDESIQVVEKIEDENLDDFIKLYEEHIYKWYMEVGYI